MERPLLSLSLTRCVLFSRPAQFQFHSTQNLRKYSTHLRLRRPLVNHHRRIGPTFTPPLRASMAFPSLSSESVTTTPPNGSPDVLRLQDEEARNYGFEKVSEQFISECKSLAVLFKHSKTGAEVMSLSNDDENKVFGIVFRTPPKDSTGIPHILEHSVLCGSRKYPVKEPFVELLKGSLHTFLNAFTYPDRTCYPVASTNTKDFYNLVDVYLDAVFFPKCVSDIKIFQQEGWHHELNDPSEEITYKGVVYNEMKGVYSQPDNILARTAQLALFPDNEYSADSGGDPRVIPQLSFDEFKLFHQRYYHPSHSRIWFYGDDNPLERLRILSGYLDEFDSSTSSIPQVKQQKFFKEPVRLFRKYPSGESGDPKKKHIVSMNWVLSESPLDLQTELDLRFLQDLMLGTPASPLRKTLLESGLGDEIAGDGFDSDMYQPQFSIGLKGVHESDVSNVEDLIMKTLTALSDQGFEDDAVAASINTIEFSLRENNTGSYPRGLSLMLLSVSRWIYGMDPIRALTYDEPLKKLKARVATEGSRPVFSPLIQNLILDNSHRVTVEMQPDPKKAASDEAEERESLALLKNSLSGTELDDLVHSTKELRGKQETPDTPDALNTIPSLSLDDIPKKPSRVPLQVGDIDGVTVLQHDLFTNDILYTEVVFSLASLRQDLLQLVPLFCKSLLEMGTADTDFVRLNRLIGQKTGGISISPFTSAVRGRPANDPVAHLIVRAKCMSDRSPDLFHLLDRVLHEVEFTDRNRFSQFVSQKKSGMEDALRGSGHSFAAARMSAKLNPSGWISEQIGGLSYLEYLRDLEGRVESDWDGIASSLREIRSAVLVRDGCVVNLTADGRVLAGAMPDVERFVRGLPDRSPFGRVQHSSLLLSNREAIVVPTQVNYVGKAVDLYGVGYELKGSAYVIANCINMMWLWDRVRVSGGAYGGFCSFEPHSGVLSFLSYRDPNLLRTLDVYDGTARFLRELDMDPRALCRAVIGAVSDVDPYLLPDAKGYNSLLRYLLGITEEEREMRRDEMLSTSLTDFRKFADAVDALERDGVVVAVVSPESIAATDTEKPNFFDVNNAL